MELPLYTEALFLDVSMWCHVYLYLYISIFIWYKHLNIGRHEALTFRFSCRGHASHGYLQKYSLSQFWVLIPRGLIFGRIHGMSWPTNGSQNKNLDFRLLFRYIYIYKVQTSEYIVRHAPLTFRLPFGGHGIPWIRSKIGSQGSLFSFFPLPSLSCEKSKIIFLKIAIWEFYDYICVTWYVPTVHI